MSQTLQETQVIVTKEQVEDAILALVDGQHDFFPYEFDDPADINNGSCEDFAFAVMAFLKYPQNLESKCGTFDQPDLWHHVWLEFTSADGSKLHFDSECEYGVESPSELPYFRRN
jgi:hypothetical protein